MTTCQFFFDWKFVAAVGASAVGIILASKVDPMDARDTLVSIADAVAMDITKISDVSKR